MEELVPSEFYLSQNYPNPFKDKTTIKYCVPDKTFVNLTVFDPNMSIVEELVKEVKEAGTYEVEFDLFLQENKKKHRFYFYRLEVSNFMETKLMNYKE